jgi:hypothetical protein
MKNKRLLSLSLSSLFLLALTVVTVTRARAIVANAILDFIQIGAPSNPSSGNSRMYFDSTTHTLTCLNSDGSSCAPSGGSGTTVTVGAYASFPGGPATGQLYITNNSPHFYRYNGSSWDAYNFGMFGPLTAMTTTNFSWVNQNSSTVTATDRDLVFGQTVGQGTDQIYHYVNSATLSIPYTYTIHIVPNTSIGGGAAAFGMTLKDSVGGKIVGFYLFTDSTGRVSLVTDRLNTETSVSGNTNQVGWTWGEVWLKIANNSTTRVYSASLNGIDYVQVLSEASGTWITENRYGVAFYSTGGSSTNQLQQVRVDHFTVQ